MSRCVPVVLAGGNGTRLWPSSRAERPKPFLPLLDGGQSPFQVAVTQAAELGPPLVICREDHRFLAREQLKTAGVQATLLLEPSPHGGGAALALAAWWTDPGSVLVVLPAEPLAELPVNGDPDRWQVGRADDRAVWDHVGAGAVRRALIALAGPQVNQVMQRLCDALVEDLDFLRVPMGLWHDVPHVGAELLRRAGRAVDVPLAVRPALSDWDALYQRSSPDLDGNVLHGDVVAVGAENCLVRSDSRLVAVLDVADLVVVETADAVLVAPRMAGDRVRELLLDLAEQGRPEASRHHRRYRPWGSFEAIGEGLRWKAKRIVVDPGHALSLQRHEHRAEHWVVVRGQARIRRGDRVFDLEVDASTYIPRGVDHRLENAGSEPLVLIEVQTGDSLDESDIVRLDDRYGRALHGIEGGDESVG